MARQKGKRLRVVRIIFAPDGADGLSKLAEAVKILLKDGASHNNDVEVIEEDKKKLPPIE
jgi:hypothetical protein